MSLRERLTAALHPDPRDVFFLAGFLLLFFGLYQLTPWLAYAVCGVLLMLISLGMRGK